jgi:hypothetical protein
MSVTEGYRRVAERLIAYWQGEEEPSPLCRSLAERLEQTLRNPGPRSSSRTDPEAVERALAAAAAVDPVARELVRKLSAPPADSPVRGGPAAPPHQGVPQTVIHADHNLGIVAGRDIRGGIVFQPPAVAPAAAPREAREEEERRPARSAQELIRILFLGANPHGSTPLRLDQEVREIDIALRQAAYRECFEFHQQWAVRVADLQRALLQHKPQILHFSGHGERTDVLIFEDNFGGQRPVQGEVLAKLLSLFNKSIRCVVLNACHSQAQAEAIAGSIDCVVGMSKAIGDAAAIHFSTSFYQALAFGSDIQTAFELGCVQIRMEELGEEHTPQLIALRRDPSEIVFANGF